MRLADDDAAAAVSLYERFLTCFVFSAPLDLSNDNESCSRQTQSDRSVFSVAQPTKGDPK
jgi:hypothetical protein